MRWTRFVLCIHVAALVLVVVGITLQLVWFSSRETDLVHFITITHSVACMLFSLQIFVMTKSSK